MVRRNGLAALALVVLLGAAGAQDATSLRVSTAVYSRYIFRGSVISPTSLWTTVSGSYAVLPKKLSLNAYAREYTMLDSPRKGGAIGALEWDFQGSATYRVAPLVTVGGGLMLYQLSHAFFSSANSKEVFANVSFDVPGHPSVTAYYGLSRPAVGTYVSVTAGQVFPLPVPRLVASVNGALDFQLGSVTNNHGHGFNDAMVRGALTYGLGAGFSVSPALDLWTGDRGVTRLSKDGLLPVFSLTANYSKRF